MPPDARTRVRQRIRRLLEDRGQTGRNFGKFMGHGDQWVSNLLAGRFALSLDELDRCAEFFRVPPGEIVRISDEPWELSPTEMKMIRALRSLPQTVRDHLVMLSDYLIGTTDEEIDLLSRIRELTPANRHVFETWVDQKRYEQAHARAESTPAAPPSSTVTPAKTVQNTPSPFRGKPRRDGK